MRATRSATSSHAAQASSLTRAPVVVGSHLDTQPAGGDFDGTVGVLAGLEIVRTLNDAGIETAAPVVVASWANEEGARFPLALAGSSVFAGILDQEAVEAHTALDGPSFGDELRRTGLAGDLPVPSFEIGTYFELHIEQSTTVEAAGADVGVVERGQGIRGLGVRLTGRVRRTPGRRRWPTGGTHCSRPRGSCCARTGSRTSSAASSRSGGST